MKKAFTLIELMIVVAIIAIIAAIAIPNLMESKKAANEGNAGTSLKTYCTAQQTFSSNNYAALNNTGANQIAKAFAETFTLLGGAAAATNQASTPIALIPPAFGDATAAANAWNGYFYDDFDSNAAPNVKYNHGLQAIPAQYGTTGVNVFIVNDTAQVYFGDTGAGAAIATDFDDEITNSTSATWAQP